MTYSIGQVESLTGIKQHILRYWEEVIPSIAVQKDSGGRRMYTLRDIDTILRIKFLVYTEGYTIEGARNRMLQDATILSNTSLQKTKALRAVKKIRAKLTESYLALHKKDENAEN